MQILNLEQGTQEWLDARCGVMTASNISKLITSQGKVSTQRPNYLAQIVSERITKELPTFHKSDAMERGNELEEQARSTFEFLTDLEVQEVGFCKMDEWRGCSPDGLIDFGTWGECGLEIKCPLGHTQVKYLKAGKVPAEYIPQIQWSMFITGMDKWHFYSYHPQIQDLHIVVERDDTLIKTMKRESDFLIEEAQELIKNWSK